MGDVLRGPDHHVAVVRRTSDWMQSSIWQSAGILASVGYTDCVHLAVVTIEYWPFTASLGSKKLLESRMQSKSLVVHK